MKIQGISKRNEQVTQIKYNILTRDEGNDQIISQVMRICSNQDGSDTSNV